MSQPVEIRDEHFERTIVLCPSRDGLKRPAERTLDWYRRKGATIIRSDGISNITEHRNLIAGIALDLLKNNRDDSGAAPYWWVLWLDDDHFVPEEEAKRLIHYALMLTPTLTPKGDNIMLVDGTLLPVATAGDPMRFAPIVSAAYPNRTKADTIAATLVHEFPLRYVPSFDDPVKKVPCFPALTGLGTALQSAPAFWEMVASSPASAALTDPGGRRPLVFQSAGTQNPRSELATFFSEDFWYCRLAWRRKLGVYIVPARSCHLVTQLVMLDPEVFDQLHDEAKQKETAPTPLPTAEPETPPKE